MLLFLLGHGSAQGLWLGAEGQMALVSGSRSGVCSKV